MTTRRELLLTMGAVPLATALPSFAQQQPAKIARIGFLGATTAADWAGPVEALRAGLLDLGYVEGKNIVIEFRWAEGKYDRLAELAAELVRLKVDLIVTHGTPGTRAAGQATTTIPIVIGSIGDAVASGVVSSLSRPGGNITGSTFFAQELSAKRLELLKEVMPRMSQVAVLLNPENASSGPILEAMTLAARSLKVGLQAFEVKARGDFENAFSTMTKKRIDAVAVDDDGMLLANRMSIAELAARQRLPWIGRIEFSDPGALIGYGVKLLESYRRAGYFVDKILKGARPGDLPVERATKFELILNLKTANALGIKFPQSILVRADRVIE